MPRRNREVTKPLPGKQCHRQLVRVVTRVDGEADVGRRGGRHKSREDLAALDHDTGKDGRVFLDGTLTHLLLLVEGCQIRHQEPDVSAIREGGIVIQCLGFLAGATSEQTFLEIIDGRNVFLLADGHAGCTIEKIEWVCKTDMAQTQSVHNPVQALGIPVCYLIGHTKQIIVAAAIADYSDLSASWVDLGNSCTERVQMFEGQALANVWVR